MHGLAIRDLWLGGPPAAAGGPGVKLRVLSFNVLAHNLTPDAVFRFVRASDADLVVLVDAKRWRWRQVIADLGRRYPYRAPLTWPHRRRSSCSAAFRSSAQIRRPRKGRPPGAALPSGGRACGRRAAARGRGRAFDWPGLCASGHRRRQRELQRLAEIVRAIDRPVIVAGDLNSTPWSPHFQDLVRAAGLRDAAVGRGYLATWPRWFWPAQIPIDHVLLKGPWSVLRLQRGPALGSDHYPLIADLWLRSSS